MNEKNMQQGVNWAGENLEGYFLTEKYNGCRLYWDGENAWSRSGNKIDLPYNWEKALPNFALDCELYDGVNGVYRCASAIRYGNFINTMKLIVFDVPELVNNYSDRILFAMIKTKGIEFLEVVKVKLCKNNKDAFDKLRKVQKRKGEGLMCYKPDKYYEQGRNNNVLKLKYVN